MLGQASPRVLLVDEDVMVRESVSRMLIEAGYSCRQAASGAEARLRLEAEPDIVAAVCGIPMPRESGLDALGAISADYPEVAVVISTGADDSESAEVALRLGAYGYLVRPFSTNELLISLAGALRRRELEIASHTPVRRLDQQMSRWQTLRGVLNGLEEDALHAARSDEAETIERLSRAVSLRDEETGLHLQRMSRYAALLAEATGYRERSAEEIRLATALHDVGKIGLPDTILLKPGPLAPDEVVAMQRHSQIGYQLLAGSASPLLALAGRVALGHHEWWDGGGYPRGLRGEEIPREARIAAVADVFDALTSHRVYRPALSVADALDLMVGLRGKQFEPYLFDAFQGVLDQVAGIKEAYADSYAERVRVLVVDDHDIFVQSLIRLLGAQPSLKVVGSAGTVAEAEQAAVAYQPDVVLMDFELPDGDGATATEAIRALVPATKVVMLTGRAEHEALSRAIAAGCVGFVTKTGAVHELLDAILCAHEGETPAAISDLPRLLAELRPTRRGLGRDLGPRELEVLRLMAAGLPNRLIAERLQVGPEVVRGRVDSALARLGAHSKLEAVATAVQEGLIHPAELLVPQ